MNTRFISKTTSVYRRSKRSHPSAPVYRLYDEEQGDFIRSVHLDDNMAAQLGRPDEVTVTIEPGDTLNSADDGYIHDVTRYDEQTLAKVRDAIEHNTVIGGDADDVINALLNAGILFREALA